MSPLFSMKSLLIFVLMAIPTLVVCPIAITNVEISQAAQDRSPEKKVLAAIDAIRTGHVDRAEALVNDLIAEQPHYRLAHLLKADLYAMRAMPLDNMGSGIEGHKALLDDLRQEARIRMHHQVNNPKPDLLPANILRLSAQQHHVIVVDTAASRLYLFKNDQGEPKRIADYYVTIGKWGIGKQKEGDKRTPLGVYFVTAYLPRAQLDKTYGAQSDLYGIGAWPISYPNEWDQREGRNGHGIWLHGSPSRVYARAPQASNGCVVLTNVEMLEVARYLKLGTTPVIIVPSIHWISRDHWQRQYKESLDMVETWQQSWQALDTPRYLSFYGQRFLSQDKQNLSQWRIQKAQIHQAQKWVKLELDELSIFTSGGPDPLRVVTFNQHYRSHSLNNRMKKRQYWHQENEKWKIAWEGKANA